MTTQTTAILITLRSFQGKINTTRIEALRLITQRGLQQRIGLYKSQSTNQPIQQ